MVQIVTGFSCRHYMFTHSRNFFTKGQMSHLPSACTAEHGPGTKQGLATGACTVREKTLVGRDQSGPTRWTSTLSLRSEGSQYALRTDPRHEEPRPSLRPAAWSRRAALFQPPASLRRAPVHTRSGHRASGRYPPSCRPSCWGTLFLHRMGCLQIHSGVSANMHSHGRVLLPQLPSGSCCMHVPAGTHLSGRSAQWPCDR
jgi:hypothetical protein